MSLNLLNNVMLAATMRIGLVCPFLCDSKRAHGTLLSSTFLQRWSARQLNSQHWNRLGEGSKQSNSRVAISLTAPSKGA